MSAGQVRLGAYRGATDGPLRVANAPCSWGTIEGFGEKTPWHTMLDELADTGYRGTELGDYGFMPTDPERLRQELSARRLVMLGGFEGVPLRREGVVAERRERLLAIARLLAAVGDEAAGRAPYFILADETRGDPHRTAVAGRVGPHDALAPAEQAVFARNAEEIARLVAGETGLRTLFHHHCAAFVETPGEIERFLDATEPGLIDLVFDTGHYTYGCGEPDDGRLALDGLERFWERVAYVHLKDCHPAVAAEARQRRLDYTQAVGAGVFCELGQGSVDLAGIVAFLLERGYRDWLTVEQDVLPGMGTPRQSAARNRQALQGLGL